MATSQGRERPCSSAPPDPSEPDPSPEETLASYDVPVALFIYNRPDHLRETFRVIRELQPTTLFILADGPKHAEDVAGCEQSRRLVREGIDWPCRLITRFSNENSGAALSVSGGLNWVF